MAEPHLLATHAELLKANLLNESLKAVIADSIKRFARASRYLVVSSKIDATIQTEEVADSKTHHSKTSHADDASKK